MATLTTIVRNTRGKGSRPVEFSGYVTEVQSIDKDGKPEFTNPRDKDATPEPIMIDCPVDNLPSQAEALSRINELLAGDDSKLRRVYAKTANAVAFALEVEKTATVAEDMLSPVFVEFNITDDDQITKFRKAVGFTFGSYVEMGRIAKDLTPEQVGEKKAKILRNMLSESTI